MKALAGAAGAVAAATLVIAAAAGGAPQQARTLTLIEHTKGASFAFVDNPPKTRFTREGEPQRLSPGDIEVQSAPVTDRQGHSLGRFHAYCIITRPGVPRLHEEQCSGTYRLRDGTISVVGSAFGSDASTFAAPIVGGTGAYEGARGTLRLVPSERGGSTDTLVLLP